MHTGDSQRAVCRSALSRLESAGRSVDFALVDGDHTAAGVWAMADRGVRKTKGFLLLSSTVGARAEAERAPRRRGSAELWRGVSEAVILLHDTANEEVREGLEAIDFSAWPKVAAVDLDFVPGYLVRVEAKIMREFHVHEIEGGWSDERAGESV